MDTRESAWTLWENLSLVKRTMCQNEFTMKEIHWLGVTGEREDGKLLYTDFFFCVVVGKHLCHLKTLQTINLKRHWNTL